FFSSSRRHTRSKRDWSSDVCSSDLEKYIWFSQTGEEQFFDLVEDPQELINVAEVEVYQKRVERRRSQLIDELTGREEGYTDGKQLIVGQAPKPTLDKVKKDK